MKKFFIAGLVIILLSISTAALRAEESNAFSKTQERAIREVIKSALGQKVTIELTHYRYESWMRCYTARGHLYIIVRVSGVVICHEATSDIKPDVVFKIKEDIQEIMQDPASVELERNHLDKKGK